MRERKMATKNKPKLQDQSYMPFGKHRNERMEDVPASYLHYLYINGIRESNADSDQGRVCRYIFDNLQSLKQEYPDGIWK